MEKQIKITVYDWIPAQSGQPGATDNPQEFRRDETDFNSFCDDLENLAEETEETAEEYHAWKNSGNKDLKARAARAKATKALFIGEYSRTATHRLGSEILERHALAIDLDKKTGPADQEEEILKSYGVAYVLHTTHTHTPASPRYRIYIPLSEPVKTPEAYRSLVESFIRDYFTRYNQKFGTNRTPESALDECSEKWNQMMYWPSYPKGCEDEFIFLRSEEGAPALDWKAFVHYSTGEIIEDKAANLEARGGITKEKEAEEKPGMIGALARAYSIPEFMQEFPGLILYEPEQVQQYPFRYSHRDASSKNGLIVYNRHFAVSYHQNVDPVAQKSNMNRLATLYDLLMANACDQNGRPLFRDEWAQNMENLKQGRGYKAKRLNSWLYNYFPKVADEYDRWKKQFIQENGQAVFDAQWKSDFVQDDEVTRPGDMWIERELVPVSALWPGFKEEIAKGIKPISTGFKGVDEIMDGGFYPHKAIYLAAVSSLGKTSFLTEVGANVAEAGNDVLLFEMESSKHEIMAKGVSAQSARESIKKTIDECIHGSSVFEYASTVNEIIKDEYNTLGQPGNLPIVKQARENAEKAYLERTGEHLYIIGGTGRLTIDQIRQVVRAMQDKKDDAGDNSPFLVIIDYLQIIKPDTNNMNTQALLDESVSALKKLAVDFNCTVITISSIARDKYWAPLDLTAFKGSGGIEYSADEAYCLEFTEMQRLPEEQNTPAGNSSYAERVKRHIAEEKEKARQGIPVKVVFKSLKNRLFATGMTTELYNVAKYGLFTEDSRIELDANGNTKTASQENGQNTGIKKRNAS